MSVNSVSSSCANSMVAAGPKVERGSDLGALRDALAAGDLERAQTAYEAFQRGKQGPNGSNPIAKQVEALGAALRSGDVDKAQGVLTDLVQKLKGSQVTDESRQAKSATPAASRVDITA